MPGSADIRFPTFAGAASYRRCCTVSATQRPASRRRLFIQRSTTVNQTGRARGNQSKVPSVCSAQDAPLGGPLSGSAVLCALHDLGLCLSKEKRDDLRRVVVLSDRLRRATMTAVVPVKTVAQQIARNWGLWGAFPARTAPWDPYV